MNAADLTSPPKTLAEILAFLDSADAGLIAATPAQMAEVGALLVAKIDNTAEVIDELENQAERLRIASAKLAEGKRQVLARVERIKEYMALHMKAGGFTQIPGECWKARLTGSESVETLCKEPSQTAIENCRQFVRTKYEWDKKSLKAALEAQDPEALALARLVPSHSVSIDVNKGKLLK